MNREALIRDCQAALTGSGVVPFVVKPGKRPPGFPRGELMNEKIVDGQMVQVRLYNAQRMLDWLNRPEVIKVFEFKERVEKEAGLRSS